MKKLVWALALLLTLLPCTGPSQVQGLSARQILDKLDDLFRGESSHGRMTMKVVTAHWSREIGIEFWSQGKDRSLIRILSPKKEQGTSTLKAGKDIWNYLPKVRRTIKLPSSMMGDAWMGSHFTNDDLVKDSRMADDFTYEATGRSVLGGEPVIEITCVPKPGAAVVWGKIVVTLRDRDVLPVSERYYSEEMKLARTMTFSDFKTLGGRLLPCRMTVVPADKPDERTEVTYQSMEFDLPLPKDMFSLRRLENK